MKKLFVLSFAVLAFASSAFATEAIKVTSITQSGNLMPSPRRQHVVKSTIAFEAMSSGCMSDADFSVEVVQFEDFQELTIIRNRVDVCEAIARPVSFTLDTTQLRRNKAVRVTNPFPVVGHFTF